MRWVENFIASIICVGKQITVETPVCKCKKTKLFSFVINKNDKIKGIAKVTWVYFEK